jgi:hypothetical protein
MGTLTTPFSEPPLTNLRNFRDVILFISIPRDRTQDMNAQNINLQLVVCLAVYWQFIAKILAQN